VKAPVVNLAMTPLVSFIYCYHCIDYTVSLQNSSQPGNKCATPNEGKMTHKHNSKLYAKRLPTSEAGEEEKYQKI
jgi:hypothetical protein